MPQHLWQRAGAFRMCEVCEAYQVERDGKFLPPVSTICPGDDDDDGARRGRRRRPPPQPSGTRVLDEVMA
jgi:hypothetical protein